MVCNAKFRADIGLKHLPFQEEEEEKRRRRKGHPNQPPSKSTGRNDGGQLLNGRPPKATAAIDAPVWLCHSYNCINRWKERILPCTNEQPMMGEESSPTFPFHGQLMAPDCPSPCRPLSPTNPFAMGKEHVRRAYMLIGRGHSR